MAAQDVQVVAGPLLSTKKPEAHWVHCEFDASVHVSAETQWLTAEQEVHTSAARGRPLVLRYLPLSQAAHCELDAVVHVCGATAQ